MLFNLLHFNGLKRSSNILGTMAHVPLYALCLALCSVGLFSLTAHSQEKPSSTVPWPSHPLKILVGFPGGSTPDMVARTLAEPLSKALGQAVVVDNKTGASGNISTDAVAKSSDDHTLGVVINGNLTSAKLLDPKLPYEPSRDFTFVSLLATSPLILLAPASLPDGVEYIRQSQANGSQWNYGSVGNGSVAHLGMELLKSKISGVQAVHIPYSGNPQVITAMLSGQIQMALVPPGVAMPQVKSGKLKAIGLTSARSPLVPEVVSLSELGVKDFQLEVWTGLVAPVGLSPTAKARLSSEISKIFAQEDFRQKLFALGWQAVGSSGEAFKARVQEETLQLGNIIKLRQIKLD
jgi:tripartite-type tricarboxylate transporter receptor subunit TctC